MDAKKTEWCIAITFLDSANNGIVALGGAGWPTRFEQDREWEKIPAASAGEDAALFADKLDHSGDRLEDRPITPSTVEALLGKPLETLIAEGRADFFSVLPRFHAYPESSHP